MNAILNYPGAKWGMASKIVELMPLHRSYLEPFFWLGCDIVNFFRVLKDCPDDLARLVSLTPYSRDIFDDAHSNRGDSPLDRAYRFAIRSRMGHGFKTYQKTGFKIDIYARERSYCVDTWNRMPENILKAAERLKKVQIEHRPALELIDKFNYENVLIYADPPYLLDTRGGKQYNYEMTEQDHIVLLAALIKFKGSVIISGYPSDIYDDMLRGWNRICFKSYNQNADPRTEVLWCNFEVGTQLSMF